MSKSLMQVLGASFIMVALIACADEGGGSAASHAALTDCNSDPAYTQASVSITNKGSQAADYEILVSFENHANGNQLETGVGVARALAPGQKTNVSVSNPKWFFKVDAVDCKIADVQRIAR